MAQAQAQLETVAKRIGAAFPNEAGHVPLVTPITALPTVVYGRAITLLWAVVACVLLIACLNVAALLLARTAAREREFAIRSSLGGTRRRVARQLLTESLLFALAGAALGVALAWAGTKTAVALFPGSVRGLADTHMDGPVLGATLLLSLATVLLFGWAPVLVASRVDLSTRLKAAGRSLSLGSGRLLGSLVTIEVAIALMLIVGAGLMFNSFVRLTHVTPGFQRENVLVVGVDLPSGRVSKYGRRADHIPMMNLFDQVIASVGTVPGVSQVAVAAGTGRGIPLNAATPSAITVEDRHRPGTVDSLTAVSTRVGVGYFDVMGIPLLAGRTFGPGDNDGDSPPVALVSESAAREFWPGGDPLGQRFTWGLQDLDNGVNDPRFIPPVLYSVVGVVGDVTTSNLRQGSMASVYEPITKGGGRSSTLLVRTSVDLESVAQAVREAAIAVDPAELEVTSVTSMDDLFSDAVAQPRFNAFLLGLLAGVALVLVLAGVYGVLAFAVRRRTLEFGLRMALGARPRELLGVVLRRGMAPVALGAAVGLALTFYIGRFLTSYLYDVRPADPLTVGATLALVFGMAALACYLPARRASAIDPVDALRME